MTKSGKKVVESAKRNGTWDAKSELVTAERVEAFAEKLDGISSAYDNFNKMPQSVRFTYTRRYFSFKGEDARKRDFEKIVDRLNKNLKPM